MSAEISLTRSARRYDAVIDAIEPPRFEGTQPKFWVTFPEYGNSELVGLGDMELGGGGGGGAARSSPPPERGDGERRRRGDSRERGEDRYDDERALALSLCDSDDALRIPREFRYDEREYRRRRDDSREREPRGGGGGGGGARERDLMEEVMRREREGSAAVGKDYAQRPASYKGSLSLKVDRFTHRKRSRSRSPPPADGRERRHRGNSPPGPRHDEPPEPPQHQRESRPLSQAEREAVARKGDYLKNRYGDASKR